MAHRYWCGECSHRTPWLTEFAAAQRQIEHYAAEHPGIPPGGHVEVDRGGPDRGFGCLHLLGIAILLLVLAAACRR
ncbi:hypothetical protein [Kitasatospora cinereorecta]|uniref:Uncharacterized protein n=1 Tax=Kitasatospora cinereorecta TaxID=285560 RepID=A0ABW0VP45_9ACTN